MKLKFHRNLPINQMHALCVPQGDSRAMNAISQANGADILQQFLEASGQVQVAQPPQNTTASLKTAKAEAQLSEASVLGGGAPETSGTLLNTYA